MINQYRDVTLDGFISMNISMGDKKMVMLMLFV